MTKYKIKKGDKIIVRAGKDNGKKGKVEKVLIKKGKVVVTGVNILKKHTKPSQKNRQGGIIEFPAPLNISNVMIVCPKCNKPSRISHKILDSGKKSGRKVRICQKCKEAI